MKRLVLASCAALLVLAPVIALAQNRPGGGGSSVGSASPRGGESGGSSSSSGGGASERSGGMSSSPGGMGSSSGGGSFSSPVAGSMRSYDGPRSGEAGMPSARPRNASASVGQPVPVSERARGDRPVYGQAAPRGSKPPNTSPLIIRGGGYDPSYYGWYGLGYPSYGSYGWYGSYYGSPYWDTWGMPMYGWGMYALPMSAYSSLWYDSAVSAAYTTPSIGSIKLRVKPKEAEVYVDGTYYGQVDNYDGTFQHLDLAAGTHKVEIRANGYETLQLQMRVLPGKTVTYTGEMKSTK